MEYKAAVSSQAFNSSHKYFIVPRGGGEVEEYRSVSTFIKALNVPSDSKNLDERDRRYTVAGIVSNPEFLKQAQELDPEGDWETHKQPFNKLIAKASRAAGIWKSAEWGTGLHAWSEDIDNGQTSRDPLPDSPDLENFGPSITALSTSWRDKGAFDLFTQHFDTMREDIQAYIDLSEAHGFVFSKVEATIVLDEYTVAGTLDRLGNVAEWSPAYHCEKPHVFDIKSGSMDHGKREKVMQFGAYAHGTLYDHNTQERTQSGACTEMAYAIHIPAGNPSEARVIPVPLDRARLRLEMAHEVWTEHSKQHRWKKHGFDEYIAQGIENASSRQELDAFYLRMKNYWTTDHTVMAKKKVTSLQGEK